MPAGPMETIERSITPQLAMAMAELEKKARAPKRVRKAPARKRNRAAPAAPPPPMYDQHVKLAKLLMSYQQMMVRLGHDAVRLSFFAQPGNPPIKEVCSCDRCHPPARPPYRPAPWDPSTPQATSMGEGYSKPGIRRA
ncbi:hypothetical protein [Qipengyuania qiaonensis]|uniref:Uncharacterized protein n=1 Tax=Qipengyuania qiaonensis TaxID=2867240 RepID=A0ABS7JDB1_9SPHN|nr:hypothetical protein [Qipengyuania qiaonensis]MBX7482967.1 hypothetical protein [Qipengyuania qiaonensis]